MDIILIVATVAIYLCWRFVGLHVKCVKDCQGEPTSNLYHVTWFLAWILKHTFIFTIWKQLLYSKYQVLQLWYLNVFMLISCTSLGCIYNINLLFFVSCIFLKFFLTCKRLSYKKHSHESPNCPLHHQTSLANLP